MILYLAPADFDSPAKLAETKAAWEYSLEDVLHTEKCKKCSCRCTKHWTLTDDSHCATTLSGRNHDANRASSGSHPTAAVRLRLPVARMMLVMSAATIVAPSLRISATRCASTLRIRLATDCLSPALVRTAFGLHSHRHRLRSRASA